MWRFLTGGHVEYTPVHVDGIVYFNSLDGYAYALDAITGELLWRYFINVAVSGSPMVVADGVVYVTTYPGFAYALKAGRGE